ncbi:acylphosphatase [Aeromicrobium sp.]|uniref:acylphosphatase n=1 Tax=Aeromicrobium sp. TaxID=1871063 RepID=UPI003D69FF71
MIRRRVIIRGRVQGVFFRASCADAAQSLGVAGWVSNEPDGTVQAVFEGDEGAVEGMVAWCHRGPAHAVVQAVEVIDEDPTGERGFQTR